MNLSQDAASHWHLSLGQQPQETSGLSQDMSMRWVGDGAGAHCLATHTIIAIAIATFSADLLKTSLTMGWHN